MSLQQDNGKMPVIYEIDVQRDVLCAVASGVYTDSDLKGGMARAATDPRYRRGMRIFVDYTGVTELRLTAPAVFGAAAHAMYSEETRRAFLVQPGLVASILELAKSSAVGKYELFAHRAHAFAWLNEGLPAAKHLT